MIFRRKGEREVTRHRHEPECSFCGKAQGDLGVRLVAGPGVYICSDCIRVANEILRGDNRPAPAAP